jgi:hypothetical protein
MSRSGDAGRPQRFRIRFGALRLVLGVMGAGPRFSVVEVDPFEVRVRLGWMFRAVVPRAHIRLAEPSSPGLSQGIGVHGWRGNWLVNGSLRGVVAVQIDPPVRAWVTGWPVRLRTLQVSLEDPDGFLAALAAAPRP